jgi:hypothetical protein
VPREDVNIGLRPRESYKCALFNHVYVKARRTLNLIITPLCPRAESKRVCLRKVIEHSTPIQELELRQIPTRDWFRRDLVASRSPFLWASSPYRTLHEAKCGKAKGGLKVCRNSVKPADKLKFLVNVTSAVIHGQKHPMVIARAAYALSKASGTLFVQLLADHIPIDELQAITFHPGMLFGDGWEASGITKDMLPCDECETATIHSKV